MKIESGYDKVWKAGCRECNYLNFGCGHHEEKPTECAELSLKADARIDELEQSLHWILTGFKSVLESKPVRDADEIICNIEKLLENKQ